MTKPVPAWLRALLVAGAAAAVLAGILARFVGLGQAPLEVDEYYFTRSIDNVLRTGWPAFACGGFYTRGLLLQYLAAAGRMGGLSPELAPRLIAAVCSVLSLPAVFLIGRYVYSTRVAILTAFILLLSVWEIEMARFGRMYAPFQAVALWYLVFYLRYAVDRRRQALWPMVALSVVSPLFWEGGVLLLMANLLPPFMREEPARFSARTWMYLVGACALLLLGYLFVNADFRGFNAASWPQDFHEAGVIAPADTLTSVTLPWSGPAQHSGWIIAALIPIYSAWRAARWIISRQSHLTASLGLLGALAAALAHQFAALMAVMLLLLLFGYVTWPQLSSRAARPFHHAIAACALFWVAFGVATVHWQDPAGGGLARQGASLAYQLVRFPDFVGLVVRPWSRAMPHLGMAVLVLVGASTFRLVRDQPLNLRRERALHIVFFVLLIAACASHPPRLETRYVLFLYPVAILMSLAALEQLAFALPVAAESRAPLAALTALLGFSMSEDFQPRHLLHINSRVETFRLTMAPGMSSHLVIRDDVRGVADWLHQHATAGDLVINGVHGVDYYYPAVNYFYVSMHDPNFEQWSCQRGTVERWGNYPLIYTFDELKKKIRASHRTFLIEFRPEADALATALQDFQPTMVWSEGYTAMIALRGTP